MSGGRRGAAGELPRGAPCPGGPQEQAGCGQRQGREAGSGSARSWLQLQGVAAQLERKASKKRGLKKREVPPSPAEPGRDTDNAARHFLPAPSSAGRCGRAGVSRMWVWVLRWQLQPAREN